MRTGLVGLGEIGRHHLAAIRACDAAELVAVCDLDPGLVEAAASGDVAGFTDLEAMLAEARLEALDICLPHSLHLPVALAAIEAGCQVLTEKPLAVDVAACERLAGAAESAGVTVAVSHNQLFYEPHERLAELLAGGALGELRALYARLWIGGRYGGWRERSDLVGGGLLMDAGVHRVYMLRDLGGPVSAVSASIDSPRAEESLSVGFEFESGARGQIDASYHAPVGVFDDRLEVLGTEGIAAVAGCEAFFEGDLREGARLRLRLDGAWRDDPVAGSWDGSVRRSVDQAMRALAGDGPPRVDAAAAREVVGLIEAAYRSAERGERVDPREVLGQPSDDGDG